MAIIPPHLTNAATHVWWENHAMKELHSEWGETQENVSAVSWGNIGHPPFISFSDTKQPKQPCMYFRTECPRVCQWAKAQNYTQQNFVHRQKICCSLSQLSQDKKQGIPWGGCQCAGGPTQKARRLFMFTFTPTASLEASVNLIWVCLEYGRKYV